MQVTTYILMQATTYMPPVISKKTKAPDSRERLIAAAIKVFARDGLYRATTRVIAEEAGVNEVTLFRHFQNKDGLLATVITQMIQDHTQEGLDDETQWTCNFKRSVQRFGEGLYAQLVRDEAFIRTMVGEAQRHPEYSRSIIMEAVKPKRARFISNLEAARKAGQVRRGIDLGIAADTFTGMLFGGMLRNTAGCIDGYTPEQYVAMCVEIFVSGLTPVPRN